MGVSFVKLVEAEKCQLGAEHHRPGADTLAEVGVMVVKGFFPITLFPSMCEWWGYFLFMKNVTSCQKTSTLY